MNLPVTFAVEHDRRMSTVWGGEWRGLPPLPRRRVIDLDVGSRDVVRPSNPPIT